LLLHRAVAALLDKTDKGDAKKAPAAGNAFADARKLWSGTWGWCSDVASPANYRHTVRVVT